LNIFRSPPTLRIAFRHAKNLSPSCFLLLLEVRRRLFFWRGSPRSSYNSKRRRFLSSSSPSQVPSPPRQGKDGQVGCFSQLGCRYLLSFPPRLELEFLLSMTISRSGLQPPAFYCTSDPEQRFLRPNVDCVPPPSDRHFSSSPPLLICTFPFYRDVLHFL